MPARRYSFVGATLADGTRTDLLIEGGRVSATGIGLDTRGAEHIDADGLLALFCLVACKR